jgi:hypothetical protein
LGERSNRTAEVTGSIPVGSTIHLLFKQFQGYTWAMSTGGETLYSEGAVTITPAIARIDDTSYPITGITSVRIGSGRDLNPVALLVGLSGLVAFFSTAGYSGSLS